MIELATDIPRQLTARINQLALDADRPVPLSADQKSLLKAQIKQLLVKHNAQLVAHYYVDADLQALAEETGGVVADSLEMANFGAQSAADLLVVCGVRFMGETAKLLSPEKTVLMPDLQATCSLDVGCPADEFAQFCAQYPDHKVVVYANTSVEVKALADWVVTSGNALQIVRHLKAQGDKIIWAPDQHLGHWIEQETGVEMIRWMGHCIVHDEFKAFELEQLKQRYPDAKVLVHPESAAAVVALADVVGSTKVLINAVQSLPDQQFIVATDQGIFYKMQQLAPHKQLIVAPTDSKAKQCISCANCPWMGMNSLTNLAAVLTYFDNQDASTKNHEIILDESKRQQALVALNRMLAFSREHGLVVKR
ncbi:quinolinate synthase NadA [Thiomicrospira cyclica]|uniref:Quinolinate synthase n=1 Tax=Thiomicrospira cyclica (strain DSM 14477 / JCM 11371 / ALM1) TaxID=717773 RepID=F6D8E1_THICA|nr:quinolinate synthase NadA [Thiomicrospira cyclica]AEG31792.1 quinolinate synthetase complex, A subunit [Thiomicrospira cyclica ALM1]